MSNYKARVIGGTLKRRIIQTPHDIKATRPTSDILKGIIFNVLEHNLYVDFPDTEAIDICAGSGSLGIEAISRGAQHCIFIDNNHMAIECITNNVQNLGISDKVSIMKSNAHYFVPPDSNNKLIIFIDPPYKDKILLDHIFNNIIKTKQHTITVVESDEIMNWEIVPKIVKRHGKSVISFFETH